MLIYVNYHLFTYIYKSIDCAGEEALRQSQRILICKKNQEVRVRVNPEPEYPSKYNMYLYMFIYIYEDRYTSLYPYLSD